MPSDRRILVGCVRQYCYCRERKYCPFDDLNDFGYVVKVKENAPELLRKALSRLPVDVIATGDYQAAEKKFEVARRMLEVCLDLGFLVSVLERSPLVLRDLDLLQEINQRAPSVVFFSLFSAPDSPTYERVRQMENLAPSMEKRYAPMEQIAKAGILTGISMIPILLAWSRLLASRLAPSLSVRLLFASPTSPSRSPAPSPAASAASAPPPLITPPAGPRALPRHPRESGKIRSCL